MPSCCRFKVKGSGWTALPISPCPVAEPDTAEVMVINDSEDEDTFDSSWSSWSSDSEDSLVSTDSSFSSAVSGEMDSSVQLDSSPSLSACSFESFDESED